MSPRSSSSRGCPALHVASQKASTVPMTLVAAGKSEAESTVAAEMAAIGRAARGYAPEPGDKGTEKM
jgi:hypothetical protein